jgi:hypothetical protein
VSVAVRDDELPFLETVTVTVPGPVPAPPDDTTAHDTGLVAFHVQLVPSVTPTPIDVDDDPIVSCVDDRVEVQVVDGGGGAGASCVTV